VENGAGRLETREADGEFAIEFQNSDRFALGYHQTYEFLPRPFTISEGVTLPVQDYRYGNGRLSFNLGPQRKISAEFKAEHGTFYNGRRTAFSVSRGRTIVSPRLSVEPSYSVNWIDLEQGAFRTHLFASRATYAISSVMFVSTLLQYNSANNTVSANARFRWEYRPGSELFVVYNEERDTRALGYPDLLNRSLILKMNRLFRF
jgi:hypothetical protein